MPENVTNGTHEKPEVEQQQQKEEEHDPHYEPIINLPLVDVSDNEENEEEMIKLRAKLYRYDSSNDPPEWKERGTGEVKLLKHKTMFTVRVVMRRDKTLKICANHFVTPWMELKPNCGTDRAWVWSVLADYTDELLKPELLAIKFANAENAQLWKDAFEKAKKIVETQCALYSGKNPDETFGDSHSESCSETEDSDDSDASKIPEKIENKESKTETPGDSFNKESSTEGPSADKVAEKLEKLEVKDETEKK